MTVANCVKHVSPNGSLPVVAKPAAPVPSAAPATSAVPLHRLHTVRCREGVTQRTVARRLHLAMAEIRHQERGTTDLLLSTLHKWREVLDVPLAELLQEPDDSLSIPIKERSRMVRAMKTAKSILEQARQKEVRRMAENLIEQLIEVMPELREIGAWHLVGQRRRADEFGRAAEQCISDDVFIDRGE
ncbi:MAG: helix-turn-helix transcriptional regulator [Candidatus Nealsonbacteria bacterium]|nr:helix-turn-helix transcriptional regulator [Candidatus Nealsonbacteria bacterium]